MKWLLLLPLLAMLIAPGCTQPRPANPSNAALGDNPPAENDPREEEHEDIRRHLEVD